MTVPHATALRRVSLGPMRSSWMATRAGRRPTWCVRPTLLLDAVSRRSALLVVDQDLLAFGQDCLVAAFPRPRVLLQPEQRSDAAPRCLPAHTRARDAGLWPRARLTRPCPGVTHAQSRGTAATHDDHLQHRRRQPSGSCVKPADHGVTRVPSHPAPAAPLIRVHDPTSDPGAIRFEVLPDTFEPKLVKAAERGQVSFIRQKHRVRAHRVGVPSAYRYERSRRSR